MVEQILDATIALCIVWRHAGSPDDTRARREAVIEQEPFNCYHSQCGLCLTFELAFYDRRQAGLPEEHNCILIKHCDEDEESKWS